MASINRRFIDKHWFVFVLRGGLAVIFGFLVLFGGLISLSSVVSMLVVFLLLMGVIDATVALYNSLKKHGWIKAVIGTWIGGV